jgi:hypothetical protein
MNLEMHMQQQQKPRSTSTLRSGFRNEAELDQLLDLVGAARVPSTPVVLAPAQAEPAPPPQPKSLNDIFSSYLKFEDDLGALCAAQGTMQKLLFGEDWWPIVDSPSTQGIYRVAETSISNLVRLAQQRFAPSGASLEINQQEALEAVGMSRWRDEYDRRNRRSETTVIPPVDLDKLWRHLEATYGGAAGVETSHRQNARNIIKELNLDGDKEMKRTSSSVSCFRRLWATKKDYGPNVGRYDFGYSSRDFLVKLFQGLACAFELAEMDQLSIELAPARHRICDYDFTFKPRERVSFTGLDIVFFKEQIEFKFSHLAAEKLMLYLGTYAAG